MTGAFSIHMQIAELQAELRVRRDQYPQLVSRGRMRTAEAAAKIDCMDAALATLMRVRDGVAAASDDLQQLARSLTEEQAVEVLAVLVGLKPHLVVEALNGRR